MLGKITTLTQQLIKTFLLTPNYNYVIFISLINLIKCHAQENAMDMKMQCMYVMRMQVSQFSPS